MISKHYALGGFYNETSRCPIKAQRGKAEAADRTSKTSAWLRRAPGLPTRVTVILPNHWTRSPACCWVLLQRWVDKCVLHPHPPNQALEDRAGSMGSVRLIPHERWNERLTDLPGAKGFKAKREKESVGRFEVWNWIPLKTVILRFSAELQENVLLIERQNVVLWWANQSIYNHIYSTVSQPYGKHHRLTLYLQEALAKETGTFSFFYKFPLYIPN